MNKKLVAIDGNSILNRAFYGIRLLTNKEGLYTNGIYGFLNILLKVCDEIKPDYICVCFDVARKTFRNDIFPEYKAGRKGMPDELRQQMPVLKEVLKAMNVAMFGLEGYEADDIIGTISNACDNNQVSCYIVTGDKDDLQLISDSTTVILSTSKQGTTITEHYDLPKMLDKYGVTPSEFIDVKGLMGDKSDNIPGVRGIGEKTALELLKKYKSIEAIYEKIDEISVTDSVRNKLKEDKDIAFLSKTLATINKNVPISFDFKDAAVKPYDDSKLFEIFTRLAFSSFIKKLGLKPTADIGKPDGKLVADVEYEGVYDFEKAEKIIEGIAKHAEKIVYEMNLTEGAQYLAINDGDKSYFLNLVGLDIPKVVSPIFESEAIKKYGHNIKKDIIALDGIGTKMHGIAFDTCIAAYIINPSGNNYDIPALMLEHMGVFMQECEKKAVQVSMLDDEVSTEGNAKEKDAMNRVFAIIELSKVLSDKIEALGQSYLYYEIELPLISVLADMEIEGIRLDKDKLLEFSGKVEWEINELVKKIYDLAGEEFNINSPKQLGEVLFEKMGLKPGKKTKTGYSTNAETLEKIKDSHEIIPYILKYRMYSKLKGTYCDGFLSVISEKDGRIHSKFNQTVTATGRISSTEPNMQNIPIRLPVGRELRKMFVAEEGKVLIDADYSQIELKVLAHMAEDKAMIEAFNNNADIHSVTASQVFGVPPELVTNEMRGSAKAVNFGIVYGMGEYSLSDDLGISVWEAKQYIEGYKSVYSGVKRFMDDIIDEATENGMVKTMFGRIRYISELKESNKNVQAAGKRIALNTPIQGTAADIIKIAMVKVSRALKNENLKAKLILQVHDELIIEAPTEEADVCKSILKREMETAAKLSVPLTVEVAMGNSWDEAHG